MRDYLARLFIALALTVPATTVAQQPEVGADDYSRAERQLSANTSPLMLGDAVRPNWLPDGRFWYRNRFEGGEEVLLVDPSDGTRERAFDHQRMASAVTLATGTPALPFSPPSGLEFDGESVTLQVDGRVLSCDVDTYECGANPASPNRTTRADVVSPDGVMAAFIRGHDLWVRDLETGEHTRLTTDGVEEFGYATNNAGWVRSERPVLKWSPDSRKIATFQHDGRGVGMMYMVGTSVGHPELEAWKYPLPGDSLIFRIERVIIDLDRSDGERVTRLDMPADQHRSTVCDHVYCGGTFADVEWSDDGARVAFVSSSRDHKRALVRIADAATGEVRDVFEEVEDTFFESGGNWRYLSNRNQILWRSQRDGWAHLYLYDAGTGDLVGQVTRGEWNVHRILEVDEEVGTVTFIGNHRDGDDPYFQYLYRVDLDSGDVALLTPEHQNHVVSLAPDGQYFIDVRSTPTSPPVSVLRDREGREVTTLETADISRLEATGWKPPTPFTVTARDGETDLFGLMFTPRDFDETKTYPVINYLYPGPQSGSVGSRSFRSSHRDLQSLAELGFVVIELDAMGTPMRSKAFHDAYYGNMGDNGLPDQIAGIRELAGRHSWIDLDRVGIYGHSGGGFASTDGILRYPDFYKVAVSQAGNHDNRNYEDDWGEKWQGLLHVNPDGTTNYDNQANQLLAENLKGKLLIAHGTMDTNVPASNTMLVVDALIAANKDFDLLLLPNRGHGFGNEPYMMRRRWDYFVRHLLGAEPPAEYRFGRLEPLVP